MAQTLTRKQRAAAEALVRGATQADAYASAYNCSRMKDCTVKQRAWELFQLSHVAAYVRELQDRAADAAVMDRREALLTLTQIARGKLGKYLTASGQIDTEKLPEAGAELESTGFSDSPDGHREQIKLRDPIRAIERLAKMLGWDQPDKLEVAGVTFSLNLGGGAESPPSQ